MGVLSTHVYIPLGAWSPRRPKEGTGMAGTGVIDTCESPCWLANKLGSSGIAANAFKHL